VSLVSPLQPTFPPQLPQNVQLLKAFSRLKNACSDKKIYNDEISEFEALERKLGYFILRNDRYGKGFNTIMKEQLAREAEC